MKTRKWVMFLTKFDIELCMGIRVWQMAVRDKWLLPQMAARIYAKCHMAVDPSAVGLLAASRWQLTHLAVGTNGRCLMAVA